MIKSDLELNETRLMLRPFDKSDLESVQGYHALPDVQRYLDWKARDAGESKLAFDAMRKQTRLTRPGDVLSMAVVRNADGAVMGPVSIKWTDATAAQGEIRFAIAPQFRRLGYGAEAVRTAMSYAFATHGFHRIFARTAGSNEPSVRLLKNLGMRLEAHYREHALFQGEWDEELHFAILDREWERGSKVKEITRRRVA